MDFNDFNELTKYVQGVCQDGLNSLKDEFTDIMQKEIINQIYEDHKPELYERTDQLKDTPEVVVGDMMINAGFVDNGDWEDWSGGHFFPMLAWDKQGDNSKFVKRSEKQGGGVYPKVDIFDESYRKLDETIPNKFKSYLMSRGFDID